MPYTRVGLTGSAMAYGTFTAKAASSASTTDGATRYRYGYQYGWHTALLVLGALLRGIHV